MTTKPPTTFADASTTATNATICMNNPGWCAPATISAPTMTMPYHASQLYSRNVVALLQHLVEDGELKLDWSDEITAGACVAGKQEVAA